MDVIVIGGGPAGLSAAIRAQELGLKVVVVEEERLGGILQQCIHTGFGLLTYKEDLTGPELAHRLINSYQGEVLRGHAASLEYSYHRKRVRVITEDGTVTLEAPTVIYAAGARERHAHEIGIVGDRVAGIYTAGEAQALMDLYGMLPGKEVVIVGSGDVGLIMARRLSLEGARVKAVVEMLPYPGGLARNLMILRDFKIPLLLNHRVVEVRGRGRVERVKVVSGQEERWIECDTLLVSAGLVPRVRLLKRAGAIIDERTSGPLVNDRLETTLPGVLVAGNSLVINDLVDYAMEQGRIAAEGAEEFIREGGIPSQDWVRVLPGENVRLVVPQLISPGREIIAYVRASKPLNDATLTFLNRRVRLGVVRPSEIVRIRVKAGEGGVAHVEIQG